MNKTGQATMLEKREVLRLNNQESNRLTRECLETALIYLMGEKPFDRITITELVKRSGVSRTAFYRNYKTKGDILKQIGDELAANLRGLLERPEHYENPYQWYVECFTIARAYEKRIRLLLNAHITLEALFENSSLLESLYPSDSYVEHYQKLAVEAAFYKVLLEWIVRGMEESAEDMAKICCRIFSGERIVSQSV